MIKCNCGSTKFYTNKFSERVCVKCRIPIIYAFDTDLENKLNTVDEQNNLEVFIKDLNYEINYQIKEKAKKVFDLKREIDDLEFKKKKLVELKDLIK
jgi:hypothetical protein